eukprot:COSAG04_NODE_2104_length_4778_cov_3.530883_4_plen_50_part_00
MGSLFRRKCLPDTLRLRKPKVSLLFAATADAQSQQQPQPEPTVAALTAC